MLRKIAGINCMTGTDIWAAMPSRSLAVAAIWTAVSLAPLFAQPPTPASPPPDPSNGAAAVADAEGSPATETAPPPSDASEDLADDPIADQMREKYSQLSEEWIEAMLAMREAQVRFHNGTKATERKYREVLQEQEPIAREAFRRLFDQAVRMLEYRPEGAGMLWEYLARAVEHRGKFDWYEGMAPAVLALEPELRSGAMKSFPSIAARTLICAGRFEEAKAYLEMALRVPEPADHDIRLYTQLEALQANHEAEQEALKSQADDLPRVEWQTTRGRVVIELYEDDAPNTVANFIRLTEEGFYDELTFYQVLDHLFAMTGDPIGDGTGSAGRQIPDEADRPTARAPLRGSLVMAKLSVPNDPEGRTFPDTASSQVLVLLLPISVEKGNLTVFGRVIEGMDAISYLTRLDPGEKKKGEVLSPPDRIIEARVLRKRDHDYEVEYVPESESAP